MLNFIDHIEAMLTYKESLGYARHSYNNVLNDFNSYLQNIEKKDEVLHASDVIPWCVRRITEGAAGHRRRLTALREFTKYLYAIGASDFVLSMDLSPSFNRYVPYIFTDAELRKIFLTSDKQYGETNNPLCSDIISVVYRLIYYCGLRPNEGRELLRKDIDLENGTLLIRKNKSHKERMIPITRDVSKLMENYIHKRDVVFPNSIYVFPSTKGVPYSSRWLSRHFLRIWREAFPNKPVPKIRVYDLRHRFATTVLMEWLDRGEDITTALPYLSAYMGHSDFRDTAYYIHLLPERLLKSDAIAWDKLVGLIPKVEI